MTLNELDLELNKKYDGCIDVRNLGDNTITIDGWYTLEELEGIVADIKAWQGKHHEQG